MRGGAREGLERAGVSRISPRPDICEGLLKDMGGRRSFLVNWSTDGLELPPYISHFQRTLPPPPHLRPSCFPLRVAVGGPPSRIKGQKTIRGVYQTSVSLSDSHTSRRRAIVAAGRRPGSPVTSNA